MHFFGVACAALSIVAGVNRKREMAESQQNIVAGWGIGEQQTLVPRGGVVVEATWRMMLRAQLDEAVRGHVAGEEVLWHDIFARHVHIWIFFEKSGGGSRV